MSITISSVTKTPTRKEDWMQFKKIVCACTLGAVLATSAALPAEAAGATNIIINGVSYQCDASCAPQNINGRVYVPLRVVSEGLGHNVSWDNATRTVPSQPISTTPQPCFRRFPFTSTAESSRSISPPACHTSRQAATPWCQSVSLLKTSAPSSTGTAQAAASPLPPTAAPATTAQPRQPCQM